MAYDGPPEGNIFFDHVVTALRAHPSVGKFHPFWSLRAKKTQFAADVVLRVRPRVKYRGSAWTFPISFPGFLVFAHAWNGFVYTGDVVTEVEILDPATLEVVDRIELATKYSMRHTSFKRGFWAGSGWWFPGYGATALLSGLIYIQYDDEATKPFHENVERIYGEYIAETALRKALALSHGADTEAPGLMDTETFRSGQASIKTE
jgi:hypothetical protein